MALIGTFIHDTEFTAHVTGENVTLTSVEETKRDNLVAAVEAYVQTETQRNFLSQSYDEIHDGDRESLFLSDRPITDPPTTIESVSTWDSNGDPDDTTEITRDKYLIRGRMLVNLGGLWPAAHIHTVYTAGYSQSDLDNWTGAEPKMLKQLILSILQREWKMEFRHISSHSFGDESDTFLFNLDPFQRSLLDKLSFH